MEQITLLPREGTVRIATGEVFKVAINELAKSARIYVSHMNGTELWELENAVKRECLQRSALIRSQTHP